MDLGKQTQTLNLIKVTFFFFTVWDYMYKQGNLEKEEECDCWKGMAGNEQVAYSLLIYRRVTTLRGEQRFPDSYSMVQGRRVAEGSQWLDEQAVIWQRSQDEITAIQR